MLINSIYTNNNIDILKKGVLNISGWVQQYRKQSDICFININDGSEPKGMQVVMFKSDNETLFIELDKINIGCYLECYGKLVDSPTKGQSLEFKLQGITVIGSCPINEYPIVKNIKFPTLRNLAHLRGRTKTFGSVFRIRNTVLYETHNFWQSMKFLNLDPNIITTNECEGGAGVFSVSEIMDNDINKIPVIKNKDANNIDYSKDHFTKKTFLTVSSQLQLEALCCSIGNCYTMNKSFRSEHSLTNKHMSEFTHLEIEMNKCENMDLMNLSKDYIIYIINKVYEKNYNDIVALDKFTCKGILKRYEELLQLKFFNVSYDECIKTINYNSKIKCSYGDDLTSEMEDFLTKFYGGAVFVYNWVLSIKSFYMKRLINDNKEVLCENFDLLLPYGVGELIGGSMREHRLNELLLTMKEKNVSICGLEWYIDLRRFGTVRHGGFGLGIDRLIMLLTGMSNIKDVVPYPVYYQHCNY